MAEIAFYTVVLYRRNIPRFHNLHILIASYCSEVIKMRPMQTRKGTEEVSEIRNAIWLLSIWASLGQSDLPRGRNSSSNNILKKEKGIEKERAKRALF